MPSFDVVSEIDMQEVRNAVDQTSREVTNRYDFKDTNSEVELNDKDMVIRMESASQDRMMALRQVLEEKLIKRKISLKAIEFGDLEDAAGGRARQVVEPQGRRLLRHGQEDQRSHQGYEAQGCPVPDPGRSGPGQWQEARRPPGP